MNRLSSILAERLKRFAVADEADEKQATQEIIQEFILYSLSKTSFFENGLFHGGTALRILYNINRYSEDLDFSLIRPDKDFQWNPYLEQIKKNMAQYGCALEAKARSETGAAVKKAFIKDNSIGQILNFSWASRGGTPEKVRIKLEVDANPPGGNKVIEKKLVFPFPYTVKSEDLPSLFAGKCHALLCREYVKGRDWYDFLWYVEKKIEPNYRYLSAMLNQSGPWGNQGVKADRAWLENVLKEKINNLDMDTVKLDILKFVNAKNRRETDRIDKEVFISAVELFHNNCLKKDRGKSHDDAWGR
jgi:hypothetical protein